VKKHKGNLPRRFRRARVLIVGCGNVGLRIVAQAHTKLALTGTNRAASTGVQHAGARAVALDLDTAQPRHKRIAALADWVIYLAPPPNQGTEDPRLKRFLAAWRVSARPKRMAYVSTSGVYGDCGGAWVNESRPVNPESDRAKRRVRAEQHVRSAGAFSLCGIASMILRAPGIYSAASLPIERLKAGTPALLPAQDVYTNHIHAEDLARICIAALLRARPNRIINASDDSQMKMGEYFDTVADAFNLPRAPRMPATELKAAVSPMLWSFMRESRRLVNTRLKTELRVKLGYPTVAEAVAAAKRSEPQDTAL
jgi:nucleoside-diphosphate-sugar epimerase